MYSFPGGSVQFILNRLTKNGKYRALFPGQLRLNRYLCLALNRFGILVFIPGLYE